ncbi:scaffolding protein [Rhizobium rhizosphaerae]|uniref:Scaffolding protein n=1 Tax=Xaviernesmea rhizosphaerae TaxID=1672749 RepID=A0A1Q9AMW5_9HYPH|nr:MipA/OmpV family protein [Xaviernesmea rhizosphaerae]OLP56695.1 scaffolding protein [Xaviernesmea rhizosphaerae]OQP88355.1 scaffolding protein [Xaviernesmea rhizosphaerae]
MKLLPPSFLALLMAGLPLSAARAGDYPWSGDWALTLGGSVANAPAFYGARDRRFVFSPILSIGRQSKLDRFVSRNDSASLPLYDSGRVSFGLAGRFLAARDENTSEDLHGLEDVRFGGEVGAFAQAYPTDWLRTRVEVRHGIRSHHGTVLDLQADAYTDITPTLRISGGPRATYASSAFGRAYYGVNGEQAAASGLDPYDPGSGWQSVGAGGALTWKATDKVETSAFVEYRRMIGTAADSSLVRQKGSENQLTVGLSASYRFDFTLE